MERPKYWNLPTVVRLICTLVLLGFVYRETGIFTVLSLASLALSIEALSFHIRESHFLYIDGLKQLRDIFEKPGKI